MVEQGSILKVEGLSFPVLVISKNRFNETGHVYVCPVLEQGSQATLSHSIGDYGFAVCDNFKRLDLGTRRHQEIGILPLSQMLPVLDRVQSIFDYL